MKKIILTLLVGIGAVICLFAQGGGSIGAAFGNKSCHGFGFSCGSGTSTGFQEMKTGLTPLSLSLSETGNTLSATIKTADLEASNPEALHYLQSHSSFVNIENISIAETVLRKLGLPAGTVASPGTYQISKEQNDFVIVFDIKEP